jgi:hypothetical protein
MKNTRRHPETQKTSPPPRTASHEDRNAGEDARARRAAGPDLMWGDEGIDDPPEQS